MEDQSDNYHTFDGVEIVSGLRVFSPYPFKWGTIDPGNYKYKGRTDPNGEMFDGWYTVTHDDGTSSTLNGTRMATSDFGMSPDPKK